MVRTINLDGINLGELKEFVDDALKELPSSTPIRLNLDRNIPSDVPVKEILGDMNSITFYDW